MRIAHFAPFAPSACGMYEAARDMLVADSRSGHKVFLVDVGCVTTAGESLEPKIGAKDSRSGIEITTVSPSDVIDVDLIIAHTGIPDNWIVKNQAPIIFVLHGRPAACFITEYLGKKVSYSIMADVAKWTRVKTMLTFWESHVDFWRAIIPEEKLECLDVPPIDEIRFSKSGKVYDFGDKRGKWNVVIADTWRDDVNTYEIASGAVEAARNLKDVKFHFFAMPNPLPGCWEYLIAELRHFGALGVIWARRNNMEEVYRAADVLLSPQRIITRTVGEALSCGTPVIADLGCKFATWHADVRHPKSVASVLESAISQLSESDWEDLIEKRLKKVKERFSLSEYSKSIDKVYRKALN